MITTERDKLAAGQVRWHSSGEDEGPDVGYELGLPDGSTLWFGEITKSLAESTVEQSDQGWFAVHYRPSKPGFVMGRIEPSWLDFGGPDELAAALSTKGDAEQVREAADYSIEGSVYIGMDASIDRDGRTVAHCPRYSDAVELLAALPKASDKTTPVADDVLVERVAKALSNADGYPPDELIAGSGGGDGYPVWRQYRDAARAALRAALQHEGGSGDAVREWSDKELIDYHLQFADPDDHSYGAELRMTLRALRAALQQGGAGNAVREADECDPCEGGAHCCCCGSYEPCCDCGQIMPSPFVAGHKCWCGAPAVRKVGEELTPDDPNPARHNLTAFVCARHYAQLMGPLGAKQVGIDAALSASPTVRVGDE